MRQIRGDGPSQNPPEIRSLKNASVKTNKNLNFLQWTGRSFLTVHQKNLLISPVLFTCTVKNNLKKNNSTLLM